VFSSLVKIPLESDVADDGLDYFRIRKAWDERRHSAVSDADLGFRNHARSRFRGDRFESLYRGRKNDRSSGEGIRGRFENNGGKRRVHFDAQLLSRPSPGCLRFGGGGVKKVRIALCTPASATFFTQWRQNFFCPRGVRNAGKRKWLRQKGKIGWEDFSAAY
jgi:hypothetical protein